MNDDDLRRAFDELKREDARRAPPFDAMWAKKAPRARASRWALVVPLASALAAAAVLVVWCRASPTASAPMAASAPAASAPSGAQAAAAAAVAEPPPSVPADDPAPLDFLLDVPGAVALATVPNLGAAHIGGTRR